MTVQELIEDKEQKIYARDWATDAGDLNVCEVYEIIKHEDRLVIL